MYSFLIMTRRAAICLTLLASVMAMGNAAANTLQIGGTGAALGTMKIMATAYTRQHPDAKIEVLPSLGSSGGIRALSAGSIGLALSARPLKEKEVAAGLQAKQYGKTAIVFAGNIAMPTTDFTDEQLVEIYQSGDARWPNGERIRVVLRPERETDTKLMKKYIRNIAPAIDAARTLPGVPTAYNDQETADMLERIPGSLGTSTLSLLLSENRRLQVFSLNGVVPGMETLRDKTYPMTKSFFIVQPKTVSEAARRFLAFVFSPEGRSVLVQNGHFVD